MPSSKTKPPRGETTSRRRHHPITGSRVSPGAATAIESMREGCGSNDAMPPRRYTTPATAAIAGFSPELPTHPQPHFNPHRRRRICKPTSEPRQPDPAGSSPPSRPPHQAAAQATSMLPTTSSASVSRLPQRRLHTTPQPGPGHLQAGAPTPKARRNLGPPPEPLSNTPEHSPTATHPGACVTAAAARPLDHSLRRSTPGATDLRDPAP